MTTAPASTAASAFDVQQVRGQFPALQQSVHGKPLVYLDSAATTQKPRCVLDALLHYYEHDNANVHRGTHELSNRATKAYEDARNLVRRHLNAGDAREIVFTRGTTESINLVAQSYGRANLQPGDEVLISVMEHHSNIVPWQLICEQTGAMLKVIPINDAGELLLDEYEQLLSKRTKIVAVTHISNVLGTVNPIKQMAAMAHRAGAGGNGAVIVVDGAQAMPHLRVDVRDLDVDFYAISAHKMYGPTGVGALFAKAELLQAMPPWQGGGEMIKSVTFDKTIYNDPPHRFEAGTPNIAGAIGFGAAVQFLDQIGLDAIAAHESDVLHYAMDQLRALPGLRFIGEPAAKAGPIAFTIDGLHPYDVSPILDHQGVAIRDGHHCAQPLMDRFGVSATMRASIGMYTTRYDIDILIAALEKARAMLA